MVWMIWNIIGSATHSALRRHSAHCKGQVLLMVCIPAETDVLSIAFLQRPSCSVLSYPCGTWPMWICGVRHFWTQRLFVHNNVENIKLQNYYAWLGSSSGPLRSSSTTSSTTSAQTVLKSSSDSKAPTPCSAGSESSLLACAFFSMGVELLTNFMLPGSPAGEAEASFT